MVCDVCLLKLSTRLKTSLFFTENTFLILLPKLQLSGDYFKSVKQLIWDRWESLTPPERDTNPSQVSSQQVLVLIYLPWKDENWVSLGRKEGRTNIQVSAKPGIQLGTLWLEGRDLTNCANHAHLVVHATQLNSLTWIWCSWHWWHFLCMNNHHFITLIMNFLCIPWKKQFVKELNLIETTHLWMIYLNSRWSLLLLQNWKNYGK